MKFPLNRRRLNKPYMYKKVFEGGRVLRSTPLTVRYFHVDQECSRLGFIIRKKVGNAPMRNSIRRTLRQCFVAALPRFPEGMWIIFDVPNHASQATRGELKAQADKMLATVGGPGIGNQAMEKQA
ncbi:MAG: rnpA: ribonuclease protein component [Fibrobacteres bacterium]|nr:rnpA: ribonuclease protein component [Fibrobacterota bacterium]